MQRARLDGVLREAVESGAVPGVVAAVSDARGLVYSGAFGTAGQGRPMREDGVFRVASMTKPATALAIMMLRDEGKLDIDRPLADYLPGYRQPPVLVEFANATGEHTTRPAARPVTIRQLLTHTAGYGYWFLDPPLLRLTDGAPELLDPAFLMHEPGERFGYGSGMDVLGQVVEPLSGLPLDRFLRSRIFEPLGMDDSGYDLPADPTRLVCMHTRTTDGFAARENERQGNAARGGSGLFSTAADYLALLRVFVNRGTAGGERLVDAATIDAMTRNQIGSLTARRQRSALPERTCDFTFMDDTQKFGFGFLVETRESVTGRSPGSYGWAGIFNTFFSVDPSAGTACVLMMQLAPFCDPACVDLRERFERAVYAG